MPGAGSFVWSTHVGTRCCLLCQGRRERLAARSYLLAVPLATMWLWASWRAEASGAATRLRLHPPLQEGILKRERLRLAQSLAADDFTSCAPDRCRWLFWRRLGQKRLMCRRSHSVAAKPGRILFRLRTLHAGFTAPYVRLRHVSPARPDEAARSLFRISCLPRNVHVRPFFLSSLSPP